MDGAHSPKHQHSAVLWQPDSALRLMDSFSLKAPSCEGLSLALPPEESETGPRLAASVILINRPNRYPTTSKALTVRVEDLRC